MKRKNLKIEFVILYILLPTLAYLSPLIIAPVPMLILVLLYIFYIYTTMKKRDRKVIFKIRFTQKRFFKTLYLQTFVTMVLLTLFLLFYDSNLIFSMLKTDPYLWFKIVIIYPFISVIPQEIIFRSFFFARYKKLFTTNIMILASAISFSYAHIMFHNYMAVILTFLGGLFFALTYHTTRSLFLVIIQHSIYGVFLFTIGYGEFFYHGYIKM